MDYKRFLNDSINTYTHIMRCKEEKTEVLNTKIKAIKFLKEYLYLNYKILEDNDLWLDDDMVNVLLQQLEIFINHFPISTKDISIVRRELRRVVLFIKFELEEMNNNK